ncbi:SDR family NAD(P)-dependent oxidoreductase [Paraburkholderia humisilvae]|uniref:3-ketoacyl-CoA thiolase n=1 Tax=Paraburkholderia humisilvae TaxID=627669 RepID=A0A6J5EH54_9BURK|nr:SDR family NAD(P)-dependent oxidoreductase [Paraburkholderia humisilvae]CAB3765819.1 3-ketoacyl-CoA thiolase [Paraburkholderia humisilvae]
MKDFIEYVVAELKQGRLSKADVLDLLRQFSRNPQGASPEHALHPLLQRNVSDLYRQCYGSTFDGTEFFFDDHQVAVDGDTSIKVLPAVAYLEMVRAAIVDALPGLDAGAFVRLEDVVWLRPIVVAPRAQVLVVLSSGADDGEQTQAIGFEVIGAPADGTEEDADLVHCRGVTRIARMPAPEPLDLGALKARMRADTFDSDRIYPAYRKMGMRFGPAHQALECVYRGQREALAQLVLPDGLRATLDAFHLHPSLFDGALQASIGLLDSLDALPGEPSLPFALDTLQVFGTCTPRMFAWIREANDASAGQLDLDLCDEEGRICATLRGFVARARTPREARADGAVRGVVLARPVWRAAPQAGNAITQIASSMHLVLLAGVPGISPQTLEAALPGAQCRALPAGGGDEADRYAAAALACFDTLRELLANLPEAGAFVHLVIADTDDGRLFAGLSGLLMSAVREHPALGAQLMLVDTQTVAQQLAIRLRAEARPGAHALVRYRDGIRELASWEELPAEASVSPSPFNERGVYLITGGLGGLGMLFAREILARAGAARVVLTGRAAPSPEIDARLDAFAPNAATRVRVAYRRMDPVDAASVQGVVAQIVAEHGRLHGVLHAAGMISDSLIAHKVADTFASVLAPKVRGTVNLDRATAHLDLDLFVLFSSGAAATGNPGQADYAAANGFMGEFARRRDALVAAGCRRGRTLSVDWPLWADGGMRMPAASLDALRETAGMVPLQTANGIAAFERSLASPYPRVLVIEGELARVRHVLFGEPLVLESVTATDDGAYRAGIVTSGDAPQDAESGGAIAAGDLADRTRDYLRKQFADLFRMPHQKIDAHAPLEKYGIDSILAMDLTRRLERTFGPLAKTLFFEYLSIDELTAYFLRAHRVKLAALLPAREEAQSQTQAHAPAATPVATRATRLRPPRRAANAAYDEPIAIVGLSGRYPQAPDLDAYWRNLRDGRDCITEIPAGRWDWRDYYSEDGTREGAHYSKWGGFIDGVDEFDPLFFNIAPVDAELIDPQERLFLQHAWMAIEDAGYTRASLQIPQDDDLPGQVGVYVGVMYGEYQLFGAESSVAGRRIGVPVSYASIANRVSYLLNLHGPSLTLDSMCSSSLSAIHLACQDLKSGRTSLAIAGGVNVTIHPNKYLILSAGRYISRDGHCQSFGIGGDGYIPGEGVGAVVLKRLSDAERDGNPIHGLLRGSALNHGGKTNGYSVPNPRAQASVIRQALKRSGVDPRQVSYIEAHGTGTKLGDPIEIAALTEVFREFTDARQTCAIGSAKSNIGHCESAAGIAGLTKVLLQMRHRQLVPSLHSSTLNRHIDFAATPFVVNQRLRDWDTPVDGARVLPRIAGISSFGAGGSNAHLIVEEYVTAMPAPIAAPGGAAIVPLSARTDAQLRQKARDLIAWLERAAGPQGTAVDLSALAYTLQVGREAMDARVAFVAASSDTLRASLRAYCDGKSGVDGCFEGADAQARDEFAALSRDEDMDGTVDKWIARGKLTRLAELWAKGFAFDWRKLHGARTPHLLSLPVYPFAKERYWIAPAAGAAAPLAARGAGLHPLLHENESDLFQQRYTTRLDGKEPFLADHRIDAGAGDARKVLPAAAYLEMVRAAVDRAMPARAKPAAWDLRDIAWVQPLVVDGPVELSVELTPAHGGRIDFTVHGVSLDDTGDTARTVHCHGHALPLAAAAVPVLDLASLGGRMTAVRRDANEVYAAFASMGIHYGPSLRTIGSLVCGDGEVLAELAMPAAPDAALQLPPSLFDGALQASLGLIDDWRGLPDKPPVPFALDSLVVLTPCAPRMFAWVRRAAGTKSGDAIAKLDVDLCDADGHVRVRASGVTSRAWRDGEERALIALEAWEDAVTAAANAPAPDTSGDAAHRRVVFCDLPQVDPVRLAQRLPGSAIESLVLSDSAADGAGRYRAATLACLAQLRAQMTDSASGPLLFQLAIGTIGTDDEPLLAGLSGLLDTARAEQPRVRAQLVLTDSSTGTDALAERLDLAARHAGESVLRFEHEAPRVRRWRTEPIGEVLPTSFRERGVYLITGGLGGLGRLFAREILSEVRDAVVVLTGRAAFDDTRRAQLDALAGSLPAGAGRLVYRQADLMREADVEALVAGLIAEFGALDGVLHSAGLTDDSLIINKTDEGVAKVLEPKVAGTLHLDRATRAVKLAFFVLFSSVAASFGNPGQADYAAANGFMDRFATRRNRLVAASERHGRTVSIGWPLWEEGGMRIDDEAAARLADQSGMRPMRTATGMRAFAHALASGAAHALVVAGDVERLQRVLELRSAPAPLTGVQPRRPARPAQAPEATEATDTTRSSEHGTLREQAKRFVVGEFAALLKLAENDVDSRASLDRYGIDSVLTVKFTQQLEHRFGPLSKTLLFEYQTLTAVANHLADTYPQTVRELADVAAQRTPDCAPPAGAPAQGAPIAAPHAPAWPPHRFAAPTASRDDAVAIIGVAGRYPQADDLRAFWRNLRDGIDCITEVPAGRWDHESLFDPRRNQPGKTYSRWGGFLNDVDRFDPLFFGISPREAELIDPQERLFIETAWETFEDAGYSRQSLAGRRVGVYVGAMWGQYELYGVNAGSTGVPSSSFASIANRVSYFFDFHGPSLALDSMCSSSLSALHFAAEAVRSGDVELALAGGVNVTVHPGKYLSLSQGGFASSDGHCRSFGAGGDGYVPGEGVGAVLLKPLARALTDGDRILAIVKASALNHGGKTNGYTVPNPVAQAELIRNTLAKAGVAPNEIDYVEAHGTGTSLGDPIEINGLVRAFSPVPGAAPLPRASCPIGSVKSNIGHLESAAGIAAVTKVLLQFRHRQLVPSLHAEPLNPHIDFDATPFRVQTTLAALPHYPGRPLRACVSSFGAGGANAHLILEAFDAARGPSVGARLESFVLSARDRTSLCVYARRVLAFFADGDAGQGEPDPAWADIAYTSQVGRTPMAARVVVIAADTAGFRSRLAQWLDHANGGAALPHDVIEGNVRDAQAGAALIDGDAGAAFLDVALRQRDLTKLAKLWVAGVEIDWARLHEAGHVRRVSLPTYPFARERYWIASAAASKPTLAAMPMTAAAPVVRTAAARTPSGGALDLMHFRPRWREAALPTAPEATQTLGPVLLIDADDAFADAFAREGHTVLRATSGGDAHREPGPTQYAIDPATGVGIDRLLDELRQDASQPCGVVLCHRTDGGIARQLECGVFALHALCQALLRDSTQAVVRIVALHAGDAAPLHAATSGYLRSLAFETPRIAGKTLALPASVTAGEGASRVWAELRETAWRDAEIRYTPTGDRADTPLRREVRAIERCVDAQTLAIADTGVAIRHRGVYLITGGMGGIGYALAGHLAKTCRARLVLSGRRASDTALERKLAELREHGGDAIYVQADIADAGQARSLVAAAQERFGRLDGVIHSAGVHRDSFALMKTRVEMDTVFATKIHGAVNLDLATAGVPLDLFVLFSSIAGTTGNPGQTDYAYANRFLDAYACERAEQVRTGTRSGRTLSIGWPFWEAGGMRIAPADIELLRVRTGLHPLPTALGLQGWDRCLRGDDVNVIPVYGEPARVGSLLARAAAPGPVAEPAAERAAQRSTALRTDADIERSTIEYLKRLLGEQIRLPVERIDADERFDAYGVDSITVNQLNAQLEEDLGALPKTLFYEYPSVGELVAYLLRHSRAALMRRFESPATTRHDVPADAAGEADAPHAAASSPSRAPAVPTGEPAGTPLAAGEKIAIVGIHGQFPGSPDLDAFWDHLRAGRDLIREVPAERWDAVAAFDADPDAAGHGKIYNRWGAFLEDVDAFDAAFFGIATDDAKLIDPQERLFLQSVWHAFEDAGYTRDTLKRRHPKARSADVGVFCGVTTHSYQMLAPDEWRRGNLSAPASMPWSITNRVSYLFDLQGPSMPVDTACSSSLVAMHLAAESLRRGDCQVAVAGGVNLYLHPSKYYSLCHRRMLARGAQCRSYGAGDDGFVPGEGVGAVVLKPLSRALAEGDRIHGVIAASAHEHAGRANGYAVPNPNAQAQLIARTLRAANLTPDAIGYVEGHGTGTQLGDSLEVAALTSAFGANSHGARGCPLGSVKSNVGHAESAAGITGVAKILLQFRHRQLAPTLHARDVNPSIDFAASPLRLQHELADWPAPEGAPRRALINSFGAGGVNACLILEEYVTAAQAPADAGQPQLIVLSARSAARLREQAGRLRDWLAAHRDAPLDAVARTLQSGRETMEERFAIVVADRTTLLDELTLAAAGTPSAAALRSRVEPHRRRKAQPDHERARLRALHAAGELRALAQCWIDGQDLDWDDLASGSRPMLVSLPGYPFEKTRHRLSDTPPATPDSVYAARAANVPPRTASLHPLVTANTSTLKEVTFASRLCAEAWYARDHHVSGTPILPGAGFVEIAWATATLAGQQTVAAFEDVVWHRPLPLAAGLQRVDTILKPAGDGAEFVIASLDADNEQIVHAEGRVLYAERGAHRDGPAHASVALDTLRAQAATVWSGEQCYATLARFGLHYGPSFRTIETLHASDGFALAQLRLAAGCAAEFGHYLLHPALIDGALQAVLGVVGGNGHGRNPAVPHVPFMLGRIECWRPLPPVCYALARPSATTDRAPGEVRQFDIALLNPRGETLVMLTRLCVRPLVPNPAETVQSALPMTAAPREPLTS